MKTLFEKWWDNDRKVFSITNYKKAWKENGNKPRITMFENGGRKRKGDNCFDFHLIIGYTIFNYCHYDMQNKSKKLKGE